MCACVRAAAVLTTELLCAVAAWEPAAPATDAPKWQTDWDDDRGDDGFIGQLVCRRCCVVVACRRCLRYLFFGLCTLCAYVLLFAHSVRNWRRRSNAWLSFVCMCECVR